MAWWKRTFRTPDGVLHWDSCAIGTFYWVVRNGEVVAIIGGQSDGKQIMTEGWPWPILIAGDWNVAWPLVEATLAGDLPKAPTYEFMTAHPEIYITDRNRAPRVPNDHQWPRPVYALA